MRRVSVESLGGFQKLVSLKVSRCDSCCHEVLASAATTPHPAQTSGQPAQSATDAPAQESLHEE